MGIGDYIAMIIVIIGIIALIVQLITFPQYVKQTKKLIKMFDEYELRHGAELKRKRHGNNL